jgi:hypothetical protein
MDTQIWYASGGRWSGGNAIRGSAQGHSPCTVRAARRKMPSKGRLFFRGRICFAANAFVPLLSGLDPPIAAEFASRLGFTSVPIVEAPGKPDQRPPFLYF